MARQNKLINVLAQVLCVALIVLAVAIGAYRHIIDLRQNVWTQYTYIQKNLQSRATEAYNLSVIAARHLPADDPVLVELSRARDGLLKDIANPDRAFLENRLLGEAATQVASKLQGIDSFKAKDTDVRFASNCIAELNAADKKIGHENYNDVALEYNKHIEGFPQSGVARAAGIGQIPLYR